MSDRTTEAKSLVTKYKNVSERIDRLNQELEESIQERSSILAQLRSLGGKDREWTIPALGLKGAKIVQRGETLFFRGGRKTGENEMVVE